MANMEDKFNDINELYRRLLPAIKTRVQELKRAKINITNRDIWNYCFKNIWINKSDLRLYGMVDDILNVDILDIFLPENNK